MGIRTEKFRRQPLIFATILLMMLALFTSRALLSIGLILFIVLTCLPAEFKQQWKRFYTNRMLAGMACLFLIPVLTWFWSANTEEWYRWARIKLPLILLPFAFAGNWQLSRQQWKIIGLFFIMLTVSGCCWSLWQYAEAFEYTNESYLRAKVFATPLENDHVRFSLVVCLAIITTIKLLGSYKRFERWILGGAILFFVVYLHILSARTGLLGFYLFLLMGILYLLFRLKQTKLTVAILTLLIAMPVIAWFTLPTFQNRIRYLRYDHSFIESKAYLPGSNDGNRMLSLQAGWDILRSHPLGVGSGDVVESTWGWYERNVPGMLETDKLYPSSEWLCYGAAAGWPGILLFTVIMLIPFFENTRDRFFWIAVNVIAAFSLMFDIGLETQFGVFIYAFTVLAWWKFLVNTEPLPMASKGR